MRSPAAAVLRPAALYVRVNGRIVGRGAELIALSNLRSGVWQMGNGTYPTLALVWTGAVNLPNPGTTGSTCNNWTGSASTGVAGFSTTSQTAARWFSTTSTCNHAFRICCVEQ